MNIFSEACSSTLGLPPEIFFYNLVPVTITSSNRKDDLSFVAAASIDTLTLFSLRGPVYSFAVHHTLENVHKSLSCLQLSSLNLGLSSNDQHIVTSGRDGRVRFWSMANFQTRGVSLELRTPNGQGVSALAQSQDDNLIAAGTELETDGPGDVAIYIWKVPASAGASGQSASPQPIIALTESHTDTITNLLFHASLSASIHSVGSGQPAEGKVTHLVTSSTDGLINVFDLNQADEDDAVVSVVNTRSAVQYLLCINDIAGGFGASGNVCVITQDEKIARYSLAEQVGDAPKGQQQWNIREQLHCDYAIDFRPFNDRPDSNSSKDDMVILAVGACKSETTTDRRVDIYTAPRKTFGEQAVTEPTITLSGGHGEEVVRDVWLNEDCPVILTCGEDGQVRAWQSSLNNAPASQSAEAEGQSEPKAKKSKKQKTKDHSGARFKPY